MHLRHLTNLCTTSTAASRSENMAEHLSLLTQASRKPWDSYCSCESVLRLTYFSFSTQALWLPPKNRPLLPGSLHLLSHWLCYSSYEGRRCHWSVSITGPSMGIQVWGPTRAFGKMMVLTKSGTFSWIQQQMSRMWTVRLGCACVE